MKKKSLVLLIIFMLSSLGFVHAEAEKEKIKHEEMRGVWVASVLNINYPTTQTTNSALLKIEADNIIKSAENAGFNAIFLQVRPTADSLYKSKIFPWSKYLTGKEGLAPANDFDPLAYFIEEAHKKNIEVHAWLNPYRITKKLESEPAYTVEMLSKNHPARLHPEYVVSNGGNLYFNPGLPEVRDLITAGVKEIIDNYDVDGIHFDDYFYPAKEFNDDDAYAKYGNGKSYGDWRRENVNKLVEQVYKTVHNAKKINKDGSKKELQFGISPFGIWANKESLASGSETKGGQSYFDHYADSVYWINHKIIDYIAPQVYWHMGFEIADFNVLTKWWQNAVRNSDVKLYIGMAAYRSDNGNSDSAWYKNFELKKQLNYINSQKDIDGFIAFSIDSIRTSNRVYNAYRGSGTINSVSEYSTPSINLYGGYKNQFVGGLIKPNTSALLNEKQIWHVSDKGFFGILVESNDDKSFTLKNNGLLDEKVYHSSGSWSGSSATPTPKNYEYLNDTLQKEVLFARTNKNEVNLRADKNVGNGSMELLPKGVIDEIECVYGDMVKLTSNRYVEVENIDILHKGDFNHKISHAKYITGNDVDTIEFSCTAKPFLKSYIKDNSLIVEFSGNIGTPNLKIPNNAIVKKVEKTHIGYRNAYVLEMKDIKKLGGYYAEYQDGKITFNIKHKKALKDNDKPLEGINIMLDAGHGGKDNGALGLLGKAYAEKNVNLDITLKLAEKLKNLGANVILTRDKEEFISLHDRLKFVFDKKPDLFISIHANSFPAYKDLNKVKGFSVYYSKDIASEFAHLAQNILCKNTACVNNKARTADFYVIRATHCPSVLLETGFMPNPEDFDWLCDDTKQDEFASELAHVIMLYFE